MDRLPQELLCLIVRDVGHDSLEPLRLVNKSFAAAAAPFLFEDVPLWIGSRSLSRLTAISEHPQLSRYPKRIFFSPLRFIDYCDDVPCKWKAERWLNTHNASLRNHSLLLAKYMSTYRSYIEAQRSLSFNGLDVKLLSKAFSQLPRLETLYFDYWDTTIGAAELRHAFGEFKAQGLLTCDSTYTLPAVVQALAASSIKIRAFRLGDDMDSYSSISGSNEDYSTAASLTIPHPRFDDGDNDDGDGYRPPEISKLALLNTFCAKKFDINKNAFRDLRELRIGQIGHFYDSQKSTFAALRALMQCVPGLEILTLEDNASLDAPLPHYLKGEFAIEHMIPPDGLNKLKELNLQDLAVDMVALIDLFRRNRFTIVKVDLSGVAISRGDWSTALVQLRRLEFPQLEVFTIDESDVKDYVLGRTDADPFVREMVPFRRAGG